MARSCVVVDSREQCSKIGDLHHALEAEALSVDQVHAELGEILAGTQPGRQNDTEIIVFDSTGTALQDVAAASLVYERAVAAGRGTAFEFNPPGVTC
jgi:ornithine cyclodeaminase/alanine dehydrogenase-like protein (mu-crystallin family)